PSASVTRTPKILRSCRLPEWQPSILAKPEKAAAQCPRQTPRAAGAADVGRSKARGTVEGASARDRGMVSNAEIGSTRGKSRSASMFDGQVRLESTGVSDDAKRKTVRTSRNAEIAKGVSNLRNVGCSMANDGRIGSLARIFCKFLTPQFAYGRRVWSDHSN